MGLRKNSKQSASVDGVLFTAPYKTASPQSAETPGLLQELDDAWLAAHFVEHTASVNGALRSSREEASAEGSRLGEEHRGALRCGDEGHSFRQPNDMENREGVAGGKGRAACDHGGRRKGAVEGASTVERSAARLLTVDSRERQVQWRKGAQNYWPELGLGHGKEGEGGRGADWWRRESSAPCRCGARHLEQWQGASMAVGRAEASVCSQGASAPARTKQRRRKMVCCWRKKKRGRGHRAIAGRGEEGRCCWAPARGGRRARQPWEEESSCALNRERSCA